MTSLLDPWFGQDGLMPHAHCYLNKPSLIWLHGASDVLIGMAYVFISITLAYMVYRIRDIPFQWVFLAFGVFIISCGGTHFMEVYTLWTPAYYAAGVLKAITAVASVGTAILLIPLIPQVLNVARSAELARERGKRIEAANIELEALYARVKDLDRLRTDFFSNVSHELRTPLTLILGPAERLMADPQIDPTNLRRAEVISRNAHTLLRHVNDLLDVSKLDAGMLTASYGRVDMSHLLRLICGNFESLSAEHGIDLQIEAPPALIMEVDLAKTERVIMNLLSNAFDFTPDGGRIRLELWSTSESAHFTIADSGQGVPGDIRPFIFERFRQGEASALRRHGGTGLGLAIAREFVELQGGTIKVGDSSLGGALFELLLPLKAPPGQAIGPLSTQLDFNRQVVPRRFGTMGSTATVARPLNPAADAPLALVIEDNADMRMFIAEALDPEYRVVLAADGLEGLERAGELQPDIILSDIMMPGMSGDQVVRELRTRPDLDGVPIILLTAKTDEAQRVDLLREGAQDFLTKPFAIAELRARVSNLVRTRRARQVLQQDLASQMQDIDALATEVAKRKKQLQLALEEAQVARDLAEHASQIKSNFLSLVSHELRTPLTIITTYLQVLARDSSASLLPRQKEMVQKMLKGAGRLKDLIESLLQYSRLKAGRLNIVKEEFDLVALVTTGIEELQSAAEQKGLCLTLNAPASLPMLRSDPRLLTLILNNLLRNALKYTERDDIEVTVFYRGDQHGISVRDSGPGIPSERLRSVFEPFEQGDAMKHKHIPGVGIGLTLVREITEELRGTISVESTLGVGSIFTVLLPSLPADDEPAEPPLPSVG